ncbi:uncharacterized protein I206_100590 [Kwoniella pini CBS 10737]|uniref:BTB domain-containing protein n=1 Tax=Kwoniella pini CBS 10737 TaxID=1296096 RepID=A0A1B9ICT9_9TREE|nr:uncharacterized protein I206_00735 [Kwoniella pini CBS 10737]OCF53432.1 hypothetical protein I206_00735 [Kwoniella pini CBS 10737]
MDDESITPSTSDQEGATSVIEIKDHPVHNDPKDDIIIISNDCIRFRASRFHLTRTSQFFDGLLGITQQKGQNLNGNDDPIRLDHSGSTISLFLDLASVSEPYVPTTTISEAAALLKLVDFAICDGLIDKARASLMEASKDEPFELLVVASDRNDVEMAKYALRKIDSTAYRCQFLSSGVTLSDQAHISIKTYLRRLSPSFHLALLEASSVAGEVRSHRYESLRPGRFLSEDWSDSVAKKFNPFEFS